MLLALKIIGGLILLVILLIFVIMVTTLKVRVHITYTGSHREMNIKFSIWKNLIQFKYNMPLEDEKVEVRFDKLTKIRRKYSVKEQLDLLINTYSQTHTSIKRFLKDIKISYVNVHLSIGTSNPALTGISSGFLYGLVGLVENLLEQFTTVLAKPIFVLSPNFNHKAIECESIIRFSVSLRKLCLIGLKIGRALLKGRKVQKGKKKINIHTKEASS
jgi:ABC-type uncharacterized transport system substrate-binding protein